MCLLELRAWRFVPSILLRIFISPRIYSNYVRISFSKSIGFLREAFDRIEQYVRKFAK